MMAITVVSECLKYLITNLLETCNQERNTVRPTDIHWVLTVPAIWNDEAKQFMRKAAIYAGMLSDSLTLALEPEAASIFCKHVKVEDDSEEASSLSTASKYALCPGSKYVLLDAGGGTVDITVHEVKWNGKIKEIHKANGGPSGGTNVDEAFVRFLENIFGKRVIADFQSHNNGDYLDMMREYELKKAMIDPQLRQDIKLKMPPYLYESYEIVNGTYFRVNTVSVPMEEIIKKDDKWFTLERQTDHMINMNARSNTNKKVTPMSQSGTSRDRAVPLYLIVKMLLLIVTLVTVYMVWIYFNNFHLAQHMRLI